MYNVGNFLTYLVFQNLCLVILNGNICSSHPEALVHCYGTSDPCTCRTSGRVWWRQYNLSIARERVRWLPLLSAGASISAYFIFRFAIIFLFRDGRQLLYLLHLLCDNLHHGRRMRFWKWLCVTASVKEQGTPAVSSRTMICLVLCAVLGRLLSIADGF